MLPFFSPYHAPTGESITTERQNVSSPKTVNWFDDVIVHAVFQTLDHVVAGGLAGDHDDRQGLVLFHHAHALEKLETGKLGHIPVEQDEIDGLFFQLDESVLSVRVLGELTRDIHCGKGILDDVSHDARIIDNQNGFKAQCSPTLFGMGKIIVFSY